MYSHLAQHREARRVLLVEDDDRLRGILARYLHARGHHVIEAPSGVDARQALSLGVVDVLLLDINLSDETGWDVLRWLRTPAAGPWLPPRVVVVSAVPPST